MSTSIRQRSGTLLKASPPSIRARLIDGRSNRSEDSRLNGSVSIRRKTSCALRIALSPSHGVEPCAARPLTSTRDREHALGLDADVQLGRLAGDREVGAASSVAHEPVGRAVLDVLGLLVGDADEAHAHGVLRGGVVDGAHHRRERALHVVRAAPDQPVALDARRELLLERRDDVEVAVQHDQRAARPAGLGEDHGQAVVVDVAHGDVARLEPALDELGRRVQAVGARGVVGDQPLGECAFVHVTTRIGSRDAGRGGP